MPTPSVPRLTSARIAGVAAASLGLVAIIGLTLSDRVPVLIGRLQHRFDLFEGVALHGDPMTYGHLVLWALIAFVAAMVPRTVAGLVAVAVALLALSFGLEAAQQMLTATRSAEMRDMQANVAGVLIGTGAGAAVATVARHIGPARRA